jgi:hypothetical protein
VHVAIERVVSSFLDRADGVLASGYSAVLYGSGARGDFVPGWSDINLLIVAESLMPDVLRALGRSLDDWRGSSPAPPLLITGAEWARAVDVFPIEIMDMREARQVLRGPDPVTGLRPAPGDLRAALERELRGKLLRLRQGYAARSGDEAALGDLAAHSASTVLVLLRGILALHDRTIPSAPLEVVSAAGSLMGIDGDGMSGVVRHRGENGWRCGTGVFEAYLDAVARTAGFVDELKIGDQR